MFNKCLKCSANEDPPWNVRRYLADACRNCDDYGEAIENYGQAIVLLTDVTGHSEPVRKYLIEAGSYCSLSQDQWLWSCLSHNRNRVQSLQSWVGWTLLQWPNHAKVFAWIPTSLCAIRSKACGMYANQALLPLYPYYFLLLFSIINVANPTILLACRSKTFWISEAADLPGLIIQLFPVCNTDPHKLIQWAVTYIRYVHT